MNEFFSSALQVIDRYALVLYVVGAIGVLLYLRKAREAYQVRRYTPFPIEREEAGAMLRDSIMILLMMVAIMGTTFYIDRVLLALPVTDEPPSAVAPPPTATSPAIGPTLEPTPEPELPPPDTPEESAPEPAAPESGIEPTATAEPTNTPEPSPSPEPTFTAAPQPSPIPTRPPNPTATPAPTTPPIPGASCPTPGVQIASPSHGQVVTGNVAVRGTADIPDFQFYKVEFGQSPDTLSVIGDVVRSPVTGGQLATWPSGAFPSGVWLLRLTVVDITGNFPAPCTIRVIVP